MSSSPKTTRRTQLQLRANERYQREVRVDPVVWCGSGLQSFKVGLCVGLLDKVSVVVES